MKSTQLFRTGTVYFYKGTFVQDHLFHNIVHHLVHDNSKYIYIYIYIYILLYIYIYILCIIVIIFMMIIINVKNHIIRDIVAEG